MVQTIPSQKTPQTLVSAGQPVLLGSTNHIKENQLILKTIFLPAMHAERGAYIYGIGGGIVHRAATNTRDGWELKVPRRQRKQWRLVPFKAVVGIHIIPVAA